MLNASPEVKARFLQEFSKELSINLRNIKERQKQQHLQELYDKEKQEKMQKINSLLEDPLIEAIECPGPDKYLIIKKNGKISLLGFSLEKEDIDEILNKLAEKAGIVLEETFKFSIENMRIIGLLSKAGSRFLVQKSI
jgi:Flp pilus assembly CpaF family ATPase